MAAQIGSYPEGDTAGPGAMRRHLQRLCACTLRRAKVIRTKLFGRRKPSSLPFPKPTGDYEVSPEQKDMESVVGHHQPPCSLVNPHDLDISRGILLLPKELQDEILHFTLLATLPRQQVLDAIELSKIGIFDSKGLFAGSISHINQICWKWMPVSPYKGPLDQKITLVDVWFRFPVGLQVNSKTRKTLTEIFYKDMVFYVWDECPRRWLAAVPRAFHDKMTVLAFNDRSVRRGRGYDCWTRNCHRHCCSRGTGTKVSLRLTF